MRFVTPASVAILRWLFFPSVLQAENLEPFMGKFDLIWFFICQFFLGGNGGIYTHLILKPILFFIVACKVLQLCLCIESLHTLKILSLSECNCASCTSYDCIGLCLCNMHLLYSSSIWTSAFLWYFPPRWQTASRCSIGLVGSSSMCSCQALNCTSMNCSFQAPFKTTLGFWKASYVDGSQLLLFWLWLHWQYVLCSRFSL